MFIVQLLASMRCVFWKCEEMRWLMSAWCLAWPVFQMGRRLLAIEDVFAQTAESKLEGLE